jgi:hypothetical protein
MAVGGNRKTTKGELTVCAESGSALPLEGQVQGPDAAMTGLVNTAHSSPLSINESLHRLARESHNAGGTVQGETAVICADLLRLQTRVAEIEAGRLDPHPPPDYSSQLRNQ